MNNENIGKINICIKDMKISNLKKDMELICKSYEEAKQDNDKEEMKELEKDLQYKKEVLFSSEKYLNDMSYDEINNKIKNSTDKQEVSRYKCFKQLKKEYAKNVDFIDNIAKADSISDVSKLLEKDKKKEKKKKKKKAVKIVAFLSILSVGITSLFGFKKGFKKINDDRIKEITWNNDSINEDENELDSSEVKEDEYNSDIKVDDSYKSKYDDINIQEGISKTIPEEVVSTPVSGSIVTEQELTPNLPEKPEPVISENIVPEGMYTIIDDSQGNSFIDDKVIDNTEDDNDISNEPQDEEDELQPTDEPDDILEDNESMDDDSDSSDEPQDEEEELKPTDEPDDILEDNGNMDDKDSSNVSQDKEEILPTEIDEDDIYYPEGKDIPNTNSESNAKENISTNTDAESEPQDEEEELQPTDQSNIVILDDEEMQQEYGISGFEISSEGKVLTLHM